MSAALLNVSTEARAMAALAQPPLPAGTLTTADIGTYAARCLARLRGDVDQILAEATAHKGSERCLQYANRISYRVDQAGRLGILAMLASRHGDDATAAAIEVDIDATSSKLIEQAHIARTLSIPRAQS